MSFSSSRLPPSGAHRHSVSRRNFVVGGLAGCIGLSLLQGRALAEGSPLRLVVGFPPGGGADAIARLLSPRLSESHGPTVVENRPGAGSRIALSHISGAKGDGSALVIAPDFALTVYPHIYRKLPYDVEKDFAPVAQLAVGTGIVLSVGRLVPERVKTLADYVNWVKTDAKVALYGTAGAGSAMDFVGQLFGRSAGIPVRHVAYKGGSPALQDVVGGQLAAAVTGGVEPLEFARSGKLRVLAVAAPTRSKLYPEAQTFAEAGYKVDVPPSWYGFLAPATTPPAVVAKLNAETNAALAVPEVVTTIRNLGLEPVTISPAQFAEVIRSESARWNGIVKELNYVAEE